MAEELEGDIGGCGRLGCEARVWRWDASGSMVLVTGLGLKVTFRCGLAGRATSGEDGVEEGSSGVFSDAVVVSIVYVVAIDWLDGYDVGGLVWWCFVAGLGVLCVFADSPVEEWSHGTGKLEISTGKATSSANVDFLRNGSKTMGIYSVYQHTQASKI